MAKKRNNGSMNISNIGTALDLVLEGHDNVIGPDFLITRNDPFNADIGHLDPMALRTYDQKFVDKLIHIDSKQKVEISDLKSLHQEYREKREQLGEYQQAFFENYVLKNDVEAAKELGNYDTYINKVVIRNEAEMNVFYDYIALYRKQNNKRAITQWRLNIPKLVNKKNNSVVEAYEKAKFAILRLDENLEHGAIKVTNVITEGKCILMDKALNESEKVGCFFICSILDMEQYIMTSGGGVTIDITSNAGKSTITLLKKHLDKLQIAKSAFNIYIAKCACEIYGFCLRGGALT